VRTPPTRAVLIAQSVSMNQPWWHNPNDTAAAQYSRDFSVVLGGVLSVEGRVVILDGELLEVMKSQ
jgi:hypothetical protein